MTLSPPGLVQIYESEPKTEDDALIEVVEKALEGLPQLADSEAVAKAIQEGLSGFVGRVPTTAEVFLGAREALRNVPGVEVTNVKQDPRDPSTYRLELNLEVPLEYIHVIVPGV